VASPAMASEAPDMRPAGVRSTPSELRTQQFLFHRFFQHCLKKSFDFPTLTELFEAYPIFHSFQHVSTSFPPVFHPEIFPSGPVLEATVHLSRASTQGQRYQLSLQVGHHVLLAHLRSFSDLEGIP